MDDLPPRSVGRVPDELLRILARNLGYEYVDLEQLHARSAFAPELIRLLPAGFAHEHVAFPVSVTDETLRLAMADPLNIHATDELERLTRMRVVPVVAHEPSIRKMIDRYYGTE